MNIDATAAPPYDFIAQTAPANPIFGNLTTGTPFGMSSAPAGISAPWLLAPAAFRPPPFWPPFAFGAHCGAGDTWTSSSSSFYSPSRMLAAAAASTALARMTGMGFGGAEMAHSSLIAASPANVVILMCFVK